MPEIEGLVEQKAALKRIKDSLNEIKDINDSVNNINAYSREDTTVKQNIEFSFTFKDGSLKRVKIPVVLSDISFIFEAAQKHKDSIVSAVKADAVQFHISLSTEEKNLLEQELVPRN